MAEMVIDVIAACELLRQVGADGSRIDLAASWIRRRMLAVEDTSRRIRENADGLIERDTRVLAQVASGSA